MAKPRKQENDFTTIAISWYDKSRLRTLAKEKKRTRNGVMHESDAELFNRLLDEYIVQNRLQHNGLNPKPTYPSRVNSQARDLQDSSSVESK